MDHVEVGVDAVGVLAVRYIAPSPPPIPTAAAVIHSEIYQFVTTNPVLFSNWNTVKKPVYGIYQSIENQYAALV